MLSMVSTRTSAEISVSASHVFNYIIRDLDTTCRLVIPELWVANVGVVSIVWCVAPSVGGLCTQEHSIRFIVVDVNTFAFLIWLDFALV